MTEIKREDRVHELMRRTIVNYEFVKAHCAKDGPYEVTQLVNSFLGALAHPWEQMDAVENLDLKNFSLNEARLRRWPVFEPEKATDCTPRTYFEMLRWTRHSFAHGNIEFFSADDQIVEIRFWNERNGPGGQRRRVWGTKVKVEVLEKFLLVFQELARERIPQFPEEGWAQTA